MNYDFSTFYPTEEERSLFKKFLDSDKTDLTRHEFDILKSTGLIRNSINGKTDWFDLPENEYGLCVISDKGIHYREYLNLQNSNKRTELIKFWIPVGISIFAAIGAYREEIVWLVQVIRTLWK